MNRLQMLLQILPVDRRDSIRPRQAVRQWGTISILLAAVIALLALSGCRSGKSIHDPDYCRYQAIGRSSWHLEAADTGESAEWGLSSLPALEMSSDSLEQVAFELPMESEQSVNDLIRLALDRNPQIAIARKELEKACARIPQAASLDDPMVELLAWPIEPNVPQFAAGRMIADVSISQTVPWRGKIEARVGEVSREVNGLQNRLLAAELGVANQVKQAYYDHWLAVERNRITIQEIQFLDELLERIEVLYQTGRVGQQDILRLQAERGLVQAEQSRWNQQRIEARAELLRLLQFDSGEMLQVADELPTDLQLSFSLDRSLERALTASPELHALWSDLQRDQWRVQQSRLDYYPDLTFMVGWGAMTTNRALAPFADGIDNINTGISMNLPSRRAKRNGALRESESQVVQTMKRWELERDDIVRDVRQIHAQLESQREQLLIYEQGVVPRFEEAVELTLVAYEGNRAGLTDLIELRRDILKFRLAESELRWQWYRFKADLQLLTAEIDW